MTAVIRAGHYGETEKELAADPIIRAMAEELRAAAGDDLSDYVHATGTPRFAFMMAAADAYRDRGGKIGSHLGGPAAALLEVLKENPHSPE